jgi:tetratricopeptide (TPR) repeat protein
MDCEQVRREELAEKYVTGHLSEAEQEAFELHYFECASCFEELRALRALQAELDRGGLAVEVEPVRRAAWRRWAWAWGVAAIVLLAGVGLLMRRSPMRPQVTTTQPASPSPKAPAETKPTLAELARVEPPEYSPAVLRGPSDQAAVRFRQAMKLYEKKQYTAAIPRLRKAVQLNPQAADAGFFLGACELLTGQTSEAIKDLQRTIALGDSPYLEDAHFYQAKAYLRQGDVAAAQDALHKTIQLHADREREARELLQQLDALVKKQP